MATDFAIEIASEHGFAVVTTRGSRSTSGSLSYYVERMANEMRIPGHRTLRTRDEALARGTAEVDDDNYAKLVELV